MSLENADFIAQLVQSNPEGSDPKSRGDDHLRLIKHVLQTQFFGFTDGIAITRKESEINAMMVAGSFGLGGPAIDITETLMSGGDIGCGFYYVTAQGLGALPVNQNSYLLQHDITNNGFAMQTLCTVTDRNVYHRNLSGGSWLPWRLHWDSTNTPKQTSVVDTISIAMLNPGSFGLGYPMIAPAGQAINSSRGQYNGRWVGNSFPDLPPGVTASNASLEWLLCNGDGGWGAQKLIDATGARQYIRHWQNGAWGTWGELLNSIGWSIPGGANCISLGPVNLHFGAFNGPIADEATVTINFQRANAQTMCVLCQPFGAGEANVTFHELHVSFTSNTGANVIHRTNGSSALAGFYWMAVGIR